MTGYSIYLLSELSDCCAYKLLCAGGLPVDYEIFPGGFGTLDELFEALTLAQTNKIEHFPIVLYDNDYWKGLAEWVDEFLLKRQKAISPEDKRLYKIVKDPQEAVDYITGTIKENGLT